MSNYLENKMLIIIKIIFLFIAILFSIIDTGRLYLKNDIPIFNNVFHAIGITGFIVCQWVI